MKIFKNFWKSIVVVLAIVLMGAGGVAYYTKAQSDARYYQVSNGVLSYTATEVDAKFTDTTITGVLRISSINTAPSTPTSTGTLGEVRFTSTGVYICISTNQWIKCVGASW